MPRMLAVITLVISVGSPAFAQDSAATAGRTAESSVGAVGQRQTRANTGDAFNIEPMARLDTRISNRIRSRLRNRIDRDYVSTADAVGAFTEANERTRNPQAAARR